MLKGNKMKTTEQVIALMKSMIQNYENLKQIPGTSDMFQIQIDLLKGIIRYAKGEDHVVSQTKGR